MGKIYTVTKVNNIPADATGNVNVSVTGGATINDVTPSTTEVYSSQKSIDTFVAKQSGKSLILDTEIARLAAMASDSNKPISNATSTALANKLDKVSTVDVEKVYVKNADGTQGLKLTSDFSGGIDPLTQQEISGAVTATEAMRNKVLLVTAETTLTIPSALFTKDWGARIIVLNGYLKLAKLGSRNWFYATPEPLINKDSDFMIRQRGTTQDVVLSGRILSNPFVAYFDTRNILVGGSNELQVKLPFISGFFQPITVDWGDGTIEDIATHNDAKTLHTYSVSGNYKVKIYGKGFFMFYNDGVEKLKINELQAWGNASAFNFFGCANLTAEKVIDIPNLVVDYLENSFRITPSLSRINRISEWNFSIFKNIKSLFYLSSFNDIINGINVSNVENFDLCFFGNVNFNQNIGNWNVSKGTSFVNFMANKAPANYSTTNYDAILNGWTERQFSGAGLTFGFGTIKRSASGTESRALMTRSNATVNVTNAANNGSGLIRITAITHGLTTGNKVIISGVVGTVGANKAFTVTVIDINTIDLQNSTFINTYISGGIVRTGWGHTITDGGL